jgi:hypothetical protein
MSTEYNEFSPEGMPSKAKFSAILSERKKHLAMALASTTLLTANAIGLADKYTKGGPRLRHLLPEPFDLFSHSGNFVLSMYAGATAAYIAARTQESEGVLSSRRHKIAAGAGILVATALNSISEIKWGINLDPIVSSQDVADPIDMGYGIAAGTLAAFTALEVRSGIKEPEAELK